MRHPVVRLDFGAGHFGEPGAGLRGGGGGVEQPRAARHGGAGHGRVYLFEFKVAEQAGEGAALAQLKARGYADKYRASGSPVHLIGVEFSRETRNVPAFEMADA